jgi:predicted DNA-binding protein
MNQKNDYEAQKKYLDKQKNLRVWVNAEKYEKFKEKANNNGKTIYALINKYIDEYIAEVED